MIEARKPVIAVHGGAGAWAADRSQHGLEGVKRAAKTGFDLLKRGGSAVDSAMEAVMVMEDDGTFNAGYGSSLNIDKVAEMEASIMNGRTLQAGATGLLCDIKNPIRLARIVMEETDHVFVVGMGAEKLAQLFKLERRDPITKARLENYEQQKKALFEGKSRLTKLTGLVRSYPEMFGLADTVGAVALDKDGNVAAATSTGGMPLKLSGRIGDSPMIGSGTYADNLAGACSATGVGEIAIRLVLAKTVCNYMENGKSAQNAAKHAIKLVNVRLPEDYNSIGVIALDTKGRIGAAHNSPNMCWAYMNNKTLDPVVALTAEIVK